MIWRFILPVRFGTGAPARALGIAAFALSALLVSCASVPAPRHSADALLVTVAGSSADGTANSAVSETYLIDGPVQIHHSISYRKWSYRTDRVPAGTYRLVSRTVELADGSKRTVTYDPVPEVVVEPSSIVLLPWKLTGSTANATVAPAPEDQRRAAEDISDIIATYSWAGRKVYGFGPYSPFGNLGKESYKLAVASDPPDARLSIDRQAWGRTPIGVDLSPGRHFLVIEREGFEPYRGFIDVQADGKELFTLREAAAAIDPGMDRMTALLEPFSNLGGERDAYLREVFGGSLAVSLGREGMQIERAGSHASDVTDPGAEPDFTEAERAGAQCVIAGNYTVLNDEILIDAALYDTRTRLVKASTLFKGKAGTDIFSSIDTMSDQFSAAVQKVMPEVGQTVVEERVLTADTVGFDRRVAERAVIDERSRRGLIASVRIANSQVFDSIWNPYASRLEFRNAAPSFGPLLCLDAPVTGLLSVAIDAGALAVNADPRSKGLWYLPVDIGPRITFSGPAADVYLGLEGALRFAPRYLQEVGDPAASQSVEVGPYWFLGANIDIGTRWYLARRRSALSNFLELGARLGLFGYRFDVDFSNPTTYRYEVEIALGWGVRL